ncbi:MAG: GTP-binding protein [Rhodobacteraceae bacterium]|nr:GTP-binding protein [Paracoccaceae bacterium]
MNRPILVLTGFLGVGKTTLLTKILADPAYRDTAVVINEFGEIPLDHTLIANADESLIETTAGCLCCTVQGDVRDALVRLLDQADAGAIPPIKRMVIETTGLADPGPVLRTLLDEPRLIGRARLAGAVTLVDAVLGEATLDAHSEARAQVSAADLMVLTKTDLASDPVSRRDVERLRARLTTMNSGAEIVDAAAPGELAPARLFGLDPLSQSDGAALNRWASLSQAVPHAHHHHTHLEEDPAAITARCLTFPDPLDARLFWIALELLRAAHGSDLLRVKGVIGLDDAPERPIVLHGVQHVFAPPLRLEAWPGSFPAIERGGRLVIIAQQAALTAMVEAFAAFEAAAESPEAATRRFMLRRSDAPSPSQA